MSSWTDRDLYVAYGFGTSDVNGYYFPSDTEDYWTNSSNNVSLVFSGVYWWIRETVGSPYVQYYYGAVDSGSGQCDGLIFANNSAYGTCTGDFPIGNVQYGGVAIESTSSSSTSSSSSSSYGQGEQSTSISSISSTAYSSSSSFEETIQLFQLLVNQGHHDILPFSFTVERGQEDDDTLGFDYKQVTNTLSYDALLSFNTVTEATTDVVVPETEESKYKHEPIFFVDIIVDGQGVSEYSLRSQQEQYTREKPANTFNIPKFTWNNSIFGVEDESESSVDLSEGYVWIGSNDKTVNKVFYSLDSATVVDTTAAPSEVYKITFGQKDNKCFVSCYDDLVIYTGSSYYTGDDDFNEDLSISNVTNDLMALDDTQSGYVISTESYQGNLVFRDRDTLLPVITYEDFDAPFKVLWSISHGSYLVAGTKTLWKMESDGTKVAAYNIKGYSIVDFDVSEKGVVGIIFKGANDYIIRFLKKDLYSITYEERVSDKDVRYCRYCEQGKFYILQEITSGAAYSTVSYIFDSENTTLTRTTSVNNINTTTTTTTLPTPTSKIEITEPTSATVWKKGNSYVIEWLSNASFSDLVKIELWKGVKLVDILTESTENTGVYTWDIAETYENGDNYSLKVIWLAVGDVSNYDISEAFTLTDEEPATTTTTTTQIVERAIGAEYNRYTGQVVVVLSNGLMGIYDLSDYTFNGLIESGVSNSKCIAIKDRKVRKFRGVSKVRVYVGNEPRLSNKWDSGVIETDKTSMYYGGGNNLVPGAKYYVNIQVYSDQYGWSEVQTKEFVMPK